MTLHGALLGIAVGHNTITLANTSSDSDEGSKSTEVARRTHHIGVGSAIVSREGQEPAAGTEKRQTLVRGSQRHRAD